MKCSACQSENDAASEVCFTCGRSFGVTPAAITRGTIIADRYEILSLLGRGGMGMVFRAHDRELDETVAVKTLRADVAREANVARRFRSEIKLARKIRHPNVCAIHEYGESLGLRFIAMEFVDGVDVSRLVRERGALPHRDAFEVAIQAARGLQAVHNAGIIHRDLKSSNIMRDTAGRVRVMDFGIAKQFGSESTLGGHVVGTPEYMSPEQARGHKLDFRSDIYAMGIVIYEVFTGGVPFQAEAPIATILMHLNDAPRLEGPGTEGISSSLVPVLRRALAKSPGERFGSASELAEALEAAREADAGGGTALAGAGGRLGQGVDGIRGSDVAPARTGEAVAAPDELERRRGKLWLLGAAGAVVAAALALRATRPHEPAAAGSSEALSGTASSVARPDALAQAPLASPLPGSSVLMPSASPVTPSGSPPPSPATTRSAEVPSARVRPSVPKPGLAMDAEKRAPSAVPTTVAPIQASNPPSTTGSGPPPAPVTPGAVPPRQETPAPRQETTTPTRRGDVVEAGPGVTPPQLVGLAVPEYPLLAKRLKRRARVLIRALVDENGKVVKAKVIEGDSSRLGFDEAAVEAAYKTSYKPAHKDGVPVRMWIELPVAFRP